MIRDHYTRTVDVLRLAPGDAGTESYAPHLSGVACHIQPYEEAFSLDVAGSFGKDFMMLCDPADILEGDRLVDASDPSQEWRVVSLESYAFRTGPRHMEMRIRKPNP